MDHFPAGSRPATQGPPHWFTGDVTVVPVIDAPAPARIRANVVTFAPGARTHWHTHPLGQTIHIMSGEGRAQKDGGPVIRLNPGDTVWFAPQERHWHGAAPATAMTHLAMQEADNGTAVTWADAVTDWDYQS